MKLKNFTGEIARLINSKGAVMQVWQPVGGYVPYATEENVYNGDGTIAIKSLLGENLTRITIYTSTVKTKVEAPPEPEKGVAFLVRREVAIANPYRDDLFVPHHITKSAVDGFPGFQTVLRFLPLED